MMKKTLFTLIAAAATLSGVSLAHAEGAYVGAGVVASRYKFDVPGALSSDDRSGTRAAGKLFGGYEFDKTWGVEAGYTDFGSKGYSFTQAGNPGRIDTDSHAFYVAGKVSAPVNAQLGVFGKLGASRNHDGASGTGVAAGIAGDSKTALYASVGAQYALNKNVALTAELEHYGKGSDFGRKANALAFGARYSFN